MGNCPKECCSPAGHGLQRCRRCAARDGLCSLSVGQGTDRRRGHIPSRPPQLHQGAAPPCKKHCAACTAALLNRCRLGAAPVSGSSHRDPPATKDTRKAASHRRRSWGPPLRPAWALTMRLLQMRATDEARNQASAAHKRACQPSQRRRRHRRRGVGAAGSSTGREWGAPAERWKRCSSSRSAA